MLAGGHGSPAVRPVGGSRATIDALVRCLQDAGGELRCGAPVDRVELRGGRAEAVVAGGERIDARRGVVSAIDARRLFLGLMADSAPTRMLRGELDRMHVGRRNVSELKVDAVLARMPDVPGPPGFERSFMLSANTMTDIERSFAEVQVGRLATRGPVMIAFPSVLEPGWAQEGQAVVWLSTFVPWSPADGPWDAARLEQAADRLWSTAERGLGAPLEPVRRRLTGPAEWVARNGNPHANPNHIEMSIDQLLSFRPSPSLARYRTPVPNLFLTGAGTHPGGGVTGVPGRNASAVVLEALGLRARRSVAVRAREQLALLRDAARAVRALRSAA
jgi:beta-carotene ketolase (CrtO type)